MKEGIGGVTEACAGSTEGGVAEKSFHRRNRAGNGKSWFKAWLSVDVDDGDDDDDDENDDDDDDDEGNKVRLSRGNICSTCWRTSGLGERSLRSTGVR